MSAVLTGIDHVQLAAPPGCEAEARRFYGDLLALREVAKPAALAGRGGVWFACGSQGVHVGVEQGFSPARKAHPAFHVRDYDALTRRLRAAEVKVVDDGSLPGVRRCYVDDPWGNRLELVAQN